MSFDFVYLPKNWIKRFYFLEGNIWSNMTSGEGCYHIIQVFEHEGKLIQTKLLILNSHTKHSKNGEN